MGTATISAMIAGRGGLWTGRAGSRGPESRNSESRAVAVQRDSRPASSPVRIPVNETASPVGLEPPSQGERAALTPERTAVIAEQKAMAALAARCVAGDGAAWEELARTQHRRIYGICYRFIGSASEAEDLTQDVFIKVFRNIDSFDPTKGGFNTWLTTLTRNMLVDNYRRARMDRVTDSLDETVSGEEDGPSKLDRLADTGRNQEQLVSGMELRTQIQEALKQVSPELREAVILRDLEDMDYKDIAEVLGVPQGTVKSRISRGRSELAKLLKRIEGQVM
jgi:RNA polymerase sigma-70 factor, ECF subfamily